MLIFCLPAKYHCIKVLSIVKGGMSLPSEDLGQAEVLESLWINLMEPPTHFGIMGVDVKRTNLIVIHCRAAGDSLVKVMKRFPNLVKNCIPMLTSSLQDTGAIEETAIGACQILTSRSVLRHLLQVGICFIRIVLELRPFGNCLPWGSWHSFLSYLVVCRIGTI